MSVFFRIQWNPKVQDFIPRPGHYNPTHHHAYQPHHNHHAHQPFNAPPPAAAAAAAARTTNITPVMQDFQNELMNSLFANDKGYDVQPPGTTMGPIGGNKKSKLPLAKDPIQTD